MALAAAAAITPAIVRVSFIQASPLNFVFELLVELRALDRERGHNV
jgi:hypothetical protein